MIYASAKSGQKISSLDADRSDDYVCPACGSAVLLKKGKVNIAHFAHKNLADCDLFPSEMSEWHLKWQEKFPIDCREVIVKHTFTEYDGFIDAYNLKINHEYSHRADICVDNYVVELQHSSITKEQFMKRNYFYNRAGYKVIWIFDYRDDFSNKRMEHYEEWWSKVDNGGKWKWKNAPRFASSIIPQQNKNVKLILQISDEAPDIGYLELITWAIDNGATADYKRFSTSYRIGTCEDLHEALAKGTL